jgi:hypothetical protein
LRVDLSGNSFVFNYTNKRREYGAGATGDRL